MTNAKNKFLEHTANLDILCASVAVGSYYDTKTPIRLFAGHTIEQLEDFLKVLDFEYDSGYGGQELFGTIWYKDGTWSSRGEYDGSEWWDYNMVPEIPEDLKGGKL